MAPVILPPEQTEFLTVSGTGTLLLTIDQRTARRLTVSIEKVKVTNLPGYYNFRIPEPSSFWGYLQLVQRDFIQETHELRFRREVVLNNDNFQLEPIEQLRCLIKDSTLLLFDNLTKIGVAQGLDPAPFGTDRANYLLTNGQPRLIPATPTTAIYYEIEQGYLGLISIIWQGYATPCINPAGTQTLPSPRSPGKDESGNNGGGGGGTRPATPPPPGRSADPDSDSPAPPPDSPAGPPSPSPGPSGPLPIGPYRVTVETTDYLSSSAPCVEIAGPRPSYVYDVNPGPATVQKIRFPGGQGYIWKLFDNNGNPITNISGSSFDADCETQVSIISQVYLGP